MTAEAAPDRRFSTWQPVGFLLALTVFFALGYTAIAAKGNQNPGELGVIWYFGFKLGVAWWVYSDRYIRNFRAPFEFDAFVFFAWMVALPYYLYRTRDRRGLRLAIGFYGLWIAPAIPAGIAYVVASIPR